MIVISSSHITGLSMHSLLFYLSPCLLSIPAWYFCCSIHIFFLSPSVNHPGFYLSPLLALATAPSILKAHSVSEHHLARNSRFFHPNPQQHDPKTHVLCCSPRPPTLQKDGMGQHQKRNMKDKNPLPANARLINPTFPGVVAFRHGA